MLDEMDDAMATVVADNPEARVGWWTTKEKFGRLRVFFELKGAPGSVWPVPRAPVERAEETSGRICQRCGAPGRLRKVDGWLATLCDAHASEHDEP